MAQAGDSLPAPQKIEAGGDPPHTLAGARLSGWTAFLVLLGVAAILVTAGTRTGALHSNIQIGGDEFFEVTKGLLWAKGIPLYTRVWSDQPPLHTVIMGTLFECFGPTIGVARAYALCWGILLLAACSVLIRKRCGTLAACIAAACLLAAPQVLDLSVSVMLEVPAIGTALWSLWAAWRWSETRRWRWLAASGILTACALQIKMTAMVVAPALLLEIALSCPAATRMRMLASVARSLAIWGGSLLLAFLLMGAAFGGTYQMLWASHFAPQMLDKLAETDSRAFSLQLVAAHTEGMWGACAGLFVVFWRRDWKRMALPLAMLCTVTTIHLNHRPWWSYYYLHFVVPLAWLTGYAVSEFVRGVWRWNEADHPLMGSFGNGLAASALVGLIALAGGTRLISNIAGICAMPRVEDSILIAKMKEFAPATKWVYNEGSIYPFHARLLAIPELAFIPAKRVWSGAITAAYVDEMLGRYQPEQLVLETRKLPLNPLLGARVRRDYILICEEGKHSLYVSKSLASPP